MTAEIKANLMGRPDAARFLISELGMENVLSPVELVKRMDVLLADYFRSVQPLPGVRKLVEHLAEHRIPMAIATGSKKANYLIKTGHLDHIFGPFGDKVICGDDPILAGKGKPDPTIFLEVRLFSRNRVWTRLSPRTLQAAKLLGIDVNSPDELSHVLVFEDGAPGVRAAKAAGMHCVWVRSSRTSPLSVLMCTMQQVPDIEILTAMQETGSIGPHDLCPVETLTSLEHFLPHIYGLPAFTVPSTL